MKFIFKLFLDFIAFISPKIKGSYIVILNYHSVHQNFSDVTDRWSISVDMFEKQIKYLVDNNIEIIGIDDIKNIFLRNQQLNKIFVCITFDDGLENNYINVIPILKKYNIYKSTFFIVANSLINKSDKAWWIKNKINSRLMSIEQIINLHKYGYEIGSHSLSHQNLNKVKDNQVENELVESKKILETQFKFNCKSVAIPFSISGNTSKELSVKNICSKIGYNYLFLGRFGYIDSKSFNKNDLPRIPIYRSDNMNNFILKINGKYNFISKIYYLRKKIRYIFGI